MDDLSQVFAPEHSGTRLAEQDARARGKDVLQAYETLGKIAMQPAHQELYTQQARHWKAQADQDELENDAMKNMQREMQEGGPLSQDPLERLYEISNRAQRAGAVKEATGAITAAGQLIQRRAAAERATAQAEKAQIEGKIKLNDTFANMLGGVTNQSTLDAANQLYQQAFGEPSPLAGQPFNPGKVKALQESTLSSKDRLNAQLRQVEERGRNWGRSITERHNRETEAIQRLEHERRERADTQRAKNGGKGVGKPSSGDLAEADLLLKTNQPDLSGDGKKLASQSIASRAMELMRANRGLGRDEAMNQAYNEEVSQGSFETGPKMVGDFEVPFTKRTTFTRTGTREKPLPIPAGDPVEAKKKMRAGKFYQTALGLLRWNGTDYDAPGIEDDEEE